MMSATVVVGHDGSLGGDAALEWGLAVARRRKAPLHVVRAFAGHWYSTGPGGLSPADVDALRAEAEAGVRLLSANASAEHPELDIGWSLGSGTPEQVLVDMSGSAELIVIGSRGESRAHTLLAGSTTMFVATHALCPVVAVPAYREGTARSGIVVGVDGSEISEVAMAFALRQARDVGQPVTACLATDDASTTEIVAGDTVTRWSGRFPDVRVTYKVLPGRPAVALSHEAAGSALLVVGCRGHSPVSSVSLGSVSHGVLHLATCPVAVVHTRRA